MKAFFRSDDYREILKDELKSRKDHNPSYSLRSFARDISLAHNRLSEILNRKVGLSRTKAATICQRIGFSSELSAYFCDLVDSEHNRRHSIRDEARARIKEYQRKFGHHQIHADEFYLIAEWIHFGVLEYLAELDSNASIKDLAKFFGYTAIEIREVLNRLARLGLIAFDKEKIRLLKERNVVPGNPSEKSIQNFHLGILKRTRQALLRADQDYAEFNTTLLAINKDDVSEAKLLIKQFWRQMEHMLNKPKKDSIYCLSIGFYNIQEK